MASGSSERRQKISQGDVERTTARTVERLPLPFIQDPKYVDLKLTTIEVRKALESKTAGRVVTLFGASGQGKTSMARHLALYYQNASGRFRDGVVFLTCSSNEVISSPLLELWKNLGYQLLPLTEDISGNASSSSSLQESWILNELTRKVSAQKILIILDDVRESTLIERFLHIHGHSLKFLITTQNPEIWGDPKCKRISIGTPTLEEACNILKNHAYGRHTDTTESMQEAIDAIVEKAAYHPLVLANVAANIQGKNGNELEEWENARRNFDELVEDEVSVLLYNERYPRTVEASMKMTMSTLEKEVETKFLLLVASIFENQSTPEVVFMLFVKRQHGRLFKFPRWSKRLQDINFIRVDWTTASQRTWSLHPLHQKFIEKIEECEVKSMVAGFLECKTNDDNIIILLLLVYGQEKWCKQAAEALEIPMPPFQNGSFQSWSFHLAPIKSFVWLIHANPEKEWEKKSHQLALQILHKYILNQELDDDSVSILLRTMETCAYTLTALHHFSLLSSPRVLIPKTMSVLINLLQPDNSTPLRTPRHLHALPILVQLLFQFPNNIPHFLSIPYAMETLMAFLAGTPSQLAQTAAARALQILAVDDANRRKIRQFPNAMQRLVSLLADNVSEGAQEAAAGALWGLAHDAENRREIGHFPNAIERLVALLADNVSQDTQKAATGAIWSLALDAENKRKIGQFPNAIERLVALLAKNVSQDTQNAAAGALGNLAVDAENRRKIGQFPNAIERLVALLANTVGQGAQEAAADALWGLAEDVQNRRKIGQFPNAMERLVALLADNVSHHAQKAATGALQILAMDVENRRKIGQFPNAIERLVALLADNVSQDTQEAAIATLRNLALDAENQRKIGWFPNAMERLVELLAHSVSQHAQENATCALWSLAEDAKNRRKIGQFPNAMERLVALLADNVSKGAQEAALGALRNLAVDAENQRKIGQFPNAIERLVGLLADNASQHAQEAAARILLNLAEDDENRRKIGQSPNAMERLVVLLTNNVSQETQKVAAGALGNLAVDGENRRKIGHFPNAMERLVALLANNVSQGAQEAASGALRNLAVDSENQRKIEQFPNAMEILVGLLADNVSQHAHEAATSILLNLAENVENRRKIGQFPNAIERLVALLADNVSKGAQESAAGALGNLAMDAENLRKIGQFPNALERLVALLANNVSEGAQEASAGALRNLAMDAENRKKIGQFPNAMERLVALLANNVSQDTQKAAAGALRNLAVDAENRRKIGQYRNAMERLVALLADSVNQGAQEVAAGALGNLAVDVENWEKIGQFPNAVERLTMLWALTEGLGHYEFSVKSEDSNDSQQATSDLSGLTQVSRDGLFGPEPRPECNLYSNPSEQAASGISGLTHVSRDSVFGRETNLNNMHLTNSRLKSQLCTSRRTSDRHPPHSPRHNTRAPTAAENHFSSSSSSGFRPWIIQAYPTSTALSPCYTPHFGSRLSEESPHPLSPPVHLDSDGDANAAVVAGRASRLSNEAATRADLEVVKQSSLSEKRGRHNMESGCPATKRVHRCDDDPSTFDATYQGNHPCQSVVQLIREVEDRHEDGYFLSSEWLLGLEQKQREFLMSILSRAGYSETYHTGMATLFERIENVVQNPIDSCNNPLSVVTESNICKDQQQVEGSKEGDAVEGLNIDKKPGSAASQNSKYLPEASGEVHIAVTTLTNEDSSYVTDPVAASPMVKDQLVNLQLEEQALEKCIRNSTSDFSPEPTTLKSFLSALKTNHLQSYAVNTGWLSRLEDHEKKELEFLIWEAGYMKMNQESNTTTFERIRDDVELPPTNLRNDATRTSDKTAVGASDTGMQEAPGTGGLLQNEKLKGKLDDEDTGTELSLGLATTVEKSLTAGEDSLCHPQILKVTCSSLSHTAPMSSTSSSHTPSSTHFHRQQFGDCIVLLPRKGESRTISTTMEKPFSMTTVDFAGGKSTCNDVCVTLKAIATSTIGCCIRIDQNPRKIRIKFSKLHGDVRREGSKQQGCNALVLSSLRTNVYACINSDESEGESDEVILKLEDEYFVPPRRRIVDDHVWLKMSEISPDNCEPGSITLELQGDVRKRLKADLAAQVQRAHVLHFQEPRPVTLEGDVPAALNPKLFLELNVRYQLEVSYIKPRTPVSKEAMFVSGMRKSEAIDFDCFLDFHVIEDIEDTISDRSLSTHHLMEDRTNFPFIPFVRRNRGP